VISDRVQIALMRDPYTQAASGATRFIARKRVGGQVVLGEAIVKLVV
jgi:HK97 family phage major capsid protein